MKKHILRVIAFFLLFFLILGVCNHIFTPKWLVEDIFDAETNRYDSFYDLEKDSLEYLTLGTSHSFHSVNPMQIYAETGIRGYDIGAPMQNLEVSYYWLKEALETQKPRYVFLCTSSMFYNDTKMADGLILKQIGSMKLSRNKLDAILQGSFSKDVKTGLLFPMYAYHDRWDGLREQDFTSAYKDNYYIFKGVFWNQFSAMYTDRVSKDRDTKLVYSDNGSKFELRVRSISGENKRTFEKIYQLCHQNDIILVPTHFPSILNWDAQSKEMLNDFLAEYDLEVFDLNDEVSNIDWHQDTSDSGGHLSHDGNAKTSAYLGKWMEQQGVDGQQGQSRLWENDLAEYMDFEESRLFTDREKALNLLSGLKQDMQNKLIIISVCDEACAGWNDLLQQKMNDINLNSDFVNNVQNSYIGIVDCGQPVFNTWSDKTLVYDGCFKDRQNETHSVYIESGGFVSGNLAKIDIDGVSYAINGRGLNIVVYDYAKNEVSLSTAIDTHESAWEVTIQIEDKANIEPVIENGAYTISSAIDKNYSLIQSKSNTLLLAGQKTNLFELEYSGNGLYFIKSTDNDGYLTVDNWGNTNETKVCFEDYTGLSSQKWFIGEYTDGTYSIYSFYNKMCLDIPAGDMTEGIQIQLFEENNEYPQRFIID